MIVDGTIKDYAKGVKVKDKVTLDREKAETERKFKARIAAEKEAERKAAEGKHQPFKGLASLLRHK